jgi:hypothetical protein
VLQVANRGRSVHARVPRPSRPETENLLLVKPGDITQIRKPSILASRNAISHHTPVTDRGTPQYVAPEIVMVRPHLERFWTLVSPSLILSHVTWQYNTTSREPCAAQPTSSAMHLIHVSHIAATCPPEKGMTCSRGCLLASTRWKQAATVFWLCPGLRCADFGSTLTMPNWS